MGLVGKSLGAGGGCDPSEGFPENGFRVLTSTEEVEEFIGLLSEVRIIRTQPAQSK